MSCSERIYLWPVQWIMNVVLDSIELQKGILTASEGYTLRFTTEMYGIRREYEVRLSEIPRNRSRVEISVGGEGNAVGLTAGQFAIIDGLIMSF